MKASMIDYNIINYSEFNVEQFPISFQKYYVDYVNDSFKGEVLIFEFDKCYVCILKRGKIGFNFIHLISEIYCQTSKEIEYESIYKGLRDYCLKNRIVVLFPPQHIHTFKNYPTDSNFYELGIIKLSLLPSEEAIFSEFKPVYRRHIRNAEKAGTIVEFGNHLFDEFYTFYEAQMVTNQAVFDQKNTLYKVLNSSKSNSLCAVARLNGRVEAVVLNLHDGTNAYYMWGASGKGAHNGSFRLLHWKLIQFYKKQGFSYYSLGGYRTSSAKTTKQEQLENFKLGFGSTIEEGYHFIWVFRPLLYFTYKKISSVLQFLRK
jgi:lipid II:glycine glycyltransferase (peptidoglycan interpeptide bridge formation enzyme)